MFSTRTWSSPVHKTDWKKNYAYMDFFSKCDQIRRKLGIWLYFKKSVMENLIFREVANA